MRISILPLSLRIAMVAGASSLGACGGADSSIGGNDLLSDAAAPSSDGGETTPRDDAAVSDATTRVDAGEPDMRIDPIELGRSWTYDVTILGTYPICKAGSHVAQVLGQKVVAGKSAFQVQSFCPGAGTNSFAVTGDRVELYYANTWVLSLDAPVAEGHTWTDGVNTYAWEKVGRITVPGGTFEDCWNARPSVGVSYTTFCRGVGPVRWHFVDGKGNGYDATLTGHGS